MARYFCMPVARVAAPRPAAARDRSTVGAQSEQASRLAKIEGVESLLKPLVDRKEDVTCDRRLSRPTIKASEAQGGAQLERQRPLMSGDRERLLKTRGRGVDAALAPSCQKVLSFESINLRFVVALAGDCDSASASSSRRSSTSSPTDRDAGVQVERRVQVRQDRIFVNRCR